MRDPLGGRTRLALLSMIARLLVQLLLPLALATILGRSLKRGGAAELFRYAAAGILAVSTLALLQPEVTYHYRAPLDASGVRTWPWLPLTALGIPLVIWALALVRVPFWACVAGGTLVGMLTAGLGGWIS
jgi:hypothetical protein